MKHRGMVFALLLGNFMTASAVLAPAGMLTEIAHEFGIGLDSAGHLMSLGAVVLCIASPLMTWLTSKIDRRTLLVATILFVSGAQVVAALSSSWNGMLGVRLAMMIIAAIFTPQAASTISMVMEPKHRPAALATAFLGYSLALAVGVPVVSALASTVGWRQSHAALAGLGVVTSIALAWGVPSRLYGTPVSIDSWKTIAGSRVFLSILLVTLLMGAGMFLVFTYLKPLLTSLTNVDLWRTSLDLTVFGLASIVGNVIASRIVLRMGPYKTSVVCLTAILVGMLALYLGAGSPLVITAGMAAWGLGFASTNSMQQARLAAEAPTLTSASIALNTSTIYVGQAIGASLGGLMVAGGWLTATSAGAAVFIGLSIATAYMSEGIRHRSYRLAAQQA